jgi:hypothetical protein
MHNMMPQHQMPPPCTLRKQWGEKEGRKGTGYLREVERQSLCSFVFVVGAAAGSAWINNFRQQQMALAVPYLSLSLAITQPISQPLPISLFFLQNNANPDFSRIYQQIARGPQSWSQEFHQIEQQLKPAAPVQVQAAAPAAPVAATAAQQERELSEAFAEAAAPTNGSQTRSLHTFTETEQCSQIL